MSGESKTALEMREIINSSLVKVQHMEGTAVYQPKDGGTWKHYWETKMRDKSIKFPQYKQECMCCGKETNPEDFVGAHIQEVADKSKQYIYPLCNVCNDTYGINKEPSPYFYVQKEYCVDFVSSEATIAHQEQ